MLRLVSALAIAMTASSLASAAPAQFHYRQKITNDLSKCYAGSGPAIMVTVDGIKASSGTLRVQSYPGTKADWLQKGHWLSRIEEPAHSGTMTFCLPVPGPGRYAVAVRHDVNGNGKTDILDDGGGMSNNPGFNIFNLGKPSYTKTAFTVGDHVTSIRIIMKYL